MKIKNIEYIRVEKKEDNGLFYYKIFHKEEWIGGWPQCDHELTEKELDELVFAIWKSKYDLQ